jgi:hypothetical protein
MSFENIAQNVAQFIFAKINVRAIFPWKKAAKFGCNFQKQPKVGKNHRLIGEKTLNHHPGRQASGAVSNFSRKKGDCRAPLFPRNVTRTVRAITRVARCAYFQTKNPNLGKFRRVLQRKILVYFIPIWSILRPFGIGIWYVVPRKIWQPWP